MSSVRSIFSVKYLIISCCMALLVAFISKCLGLGSTLEQHPLNTSHPLLSLACYAKSSLPLVLLLLFMYPNFILLWIIDCLEGGREVLRRGLWFPLRFLYLHLSSLNLCHLISAVVVILFGLDCVINFVLVYFHILHIHCFIINLNW